MLASHKELLEASNKLLEYTQAILGYTDMSDYTEIFVATTVASMLIGCVNQDTDQLDIPRLQQARDVVISKLRSALNALIDHQMQRQSKCSAKH
jgi:hypothetical protein